MNKYQEALESLHRSAKFLLGSQVNKEKQILQELVDKETPMKPYYPKDYPVPECPICKSNIGDNPRCRNCGQAILWEE